MQKAGLAYSEQIREKAFRHFIKPARDAGWQQFSISVRELMDLFEPEFAFNRQGQFCSALLKRRFLDENGLEVVERHGPVSKRSTTVSYDYRFRRAPESRVVIEPMADSEAKAEAHRLVEGMRGLLKREVAAYGGTDEFVRWVRSEELAG